MSKPFDPNSATDSSTPPDDPDARLYSLARAALRAAALGEGRSHARVFASANERAPSDDELREIFAGAFSRAAALVEHPDDRDAFERWSAKELTRILGAPDWS